MRRRPASFKDLVKIMAKLRAPGGCPWDRQQTHASLLKYLDEESAEVAHAVKRDDFANLEEELGDVLLQVLFHADIAREAGRFDIHDVVGGIHDKLVRRHPHVFGKGRRKKLSAEEVIRQWDVLKAAEKRRKRRKK